jgi:hypothetical protein
MTAEPGPQKYPGAKLEAADWLVSSGTAGHRRVSGEWAKTVQSFGRVSEVTGFQFRVEHLFLLQLALSGPDLVRLGSVRYLRLAPSRFSFDG